MVHDGNVAEVEFDSDKIIIKPIEGYVEEGMWGTPISYTYYTGYVGDEELIQELKELPDVKVKGHIPDSSSSIIEFLFVYVLPMVLMVAMFAFIYRRMSSGGDDGEATAILNVTRSTEEAFWALECVGIHTTRNSSASACPSAIVCTVSAAPV